MKQMCITEYNEAETMERFREEGETRGQEKVAVAMLRDHLALDKVVLYSGLPMARVLELQKSLIEI